MPRSSTILALCVILGASVWSASARLGQPEAESCSFMKSLISGTFGSNEDIWLCIAFRESSYNPSARNPFSGATGLFQVETIHCGEMAGCPAAGSGCVSGLEDPYTNAACARSVYNAQGFGAWTTYPECTSGQSPCASEESDAKMSDSEDGVPMMGLMAPLVPAPKSA